MIFTDSDPNLLNISLSRPNLNLSYDLDPDFFLVALICDVKNKEVSESERALYDYYQDHGIYMTVMWLGLIHLAIILIRYFKWWKYSGLVHAVLGTIVLFFTWISATNTYIKDDSSFATIKSNSDILHHSRNGLTILALTMSQFLFGLYFKFNQILTRKIRLNNFLRVIHQFLGWILPIMGLINIKFGWTYHADYRLQYIYPCYFILVMVIITFEIYHRYGLKIDHYLLSFRGYSLQKATVSMIASKDSHLSQMMVSGTENSHIEIYEEILKNKREWAFLDEFVVDLSGFKWNHPGGNFIFPLVYGQDIGKYINGCSSIINEINPYYHSENARKMLNFLKIGTVSYGHGVFTNIYPAENESSMNWTLTDNKMISSVTHCLEFSSLSWKLNSEPPGYEWMGKHFLISHKINGKLISRYYSLVVVNLAIWASEVRNSGFICKNYSMQKVQGKLRLHVKDYDNGKMSSSLCALPLGSVINIKGPIGPGLCIRNIEDKQYLIVAAGTGILPFLDIVYAIWAGKITKACFYMYAAFKKEEEGFAIDLLSATSKKCSQNFQLIVRLGKESYEQESEFWKNIMPLSTAERAWICGPSIFNRKLEKILKTEGFDPEKIIIL